MIRFVKVVHKISSVLSIILFIALVVVVAYPENKCLANDKLVEDEYHIKSYEIVEPNRVYEPETEYYHEHEVFERERMNDSTIVYYKSSLCEPFEYSKEEDIGDVDNKISTDAYYDDLHLLAHLIGGEAGADWCSDTMQLYVGSVVLNRVQSEYYPNNLYDVIYQSGQYACTWDGNFDREPTQRCWDTAQYLLDNGSVLPENVVYQAEFTQGDGIYAQEQNMYFCFYN